MCMLFRDLTYQIVKHVFFFVVVAVAVFVFFLLANCTCSQVNVEGFW